MYACMYVCMYVHVYVHGMSMTFIYMDACTYTHTNGSTIVQQGIRELSLL